MKKTVAIVLALLLLVGIMPVAAFAEDTKPAYSGGSGTEDDPYLISSVEDLQALAETINSGAAQEYGNYIGVYFKQTKDIDLSGVDWEPIGYSASGFYFSGNYDGDNHIIRNMETEGKLTVTDNPDYKDQNSAGFFGWVAFGSVSNLHIVDAKTVIAETATGQPYAGGLAAVIYSSSVYNCSVTNSNITVSRGIDNSSWAGGLTGWSHGESKFENCASVGNAVTGNHYVGGMAGQAASYDGTRVDVEFLNCYVADCVLTGTGTKTSFSSYIAGFVAHVDFDVASSVLSFENCHAYNNIISLSDESAEVGKRLIQGVYVGSIYMNGNTYYGVVTHDNTYYYTEDTENLGEEGTFTGTEAKTLEEFADGTVNDLLGEAFIQAENYPVLESIPDLYKEDEEEPEEPVWKPSGKPACDHEFDEDGVCTECGVKVIGSVEVKPEEGETNPNTGAEKAVGAAAAIAVLSLIAAASIIKK